LPTFTFKSPFSAPKQAWGPEARALRGKSVGPRISDCGFQISDLFDFFFNPHSAIGIPQFGGGPLGRPAGRPYMGIPLFSEKERFARPCPRKDRCLMIFARKALASGPGRA
jgi:hypothetical protein